MNTTEKEITNPMIEMDAREFGLHLKEGGWRLGLLVARSVKPGEGSGEVNLVAVATRLEEGEKVSARKFADLANCSVDRVMRYYRAWERYAAKGKVAPAADLEPGEEPNYDWDHLPRWTLSETPTEGATGPLNLTIKLGQFGTRLLRSHKRFITFTTKDVEEFKTRPGKATKRLAGLYADCLETEARLLRKIEKGESLPPKEEIVQELDPSKFFETEGA